MTPSAEIICTTYLPQFGGVYFGLKNRYKIVLNIVNFFFFNSSWCHGKHLKNSNDCIIFCYKRKSWNKLPKRARTWDYILNFSATVYGGRSCIVGDARWSNPKFFEHFWLQSLHDKTYCSSTEKILSQKDNICFPYYNFWSTIN